MSVYFLSLGGIKNDTRYEYVATQYCDGLRGALIIHDPQDPHKALYDIDDGKFVLCHKQKS